MELKDADLMAGYAQYASASELMVDESVDAPASTPTIAASIVVSTIVIASTVSTWTAGC